MYGTCCVRAQIPYFIPEIKAKTLSANQITGYLNQLFLQNKSIKQPHVLHVDTNSQKLKVY